MLLSSQRIMFEIYREGAYDRRFRVVYFTELTDHNKEAEINAAVAGEHVFDGFILETTAKDAKRAIEAILHQLNTGRPLTPDQIEQALTPYMPEE